MKWPHMESIWKGKYQSKNGKISTCQASCRLGAAPREASGICWCPAWEGRDKASTAGPQHSGDQGFSYACRKSFSFNLAGFRSISQKLKTSTLARLCPQIVMTKREIPGAGGRKLLKVQVPPGIWGMGDHPCLP